MTDVFSHNNLQSSKIRWNQDEEIVKSIDEFQVLFFFSSSTSIEWMSDSIEHDNSVVLADIQHDDNRLEIFYVEMNIIEDLSYC